MKISVDNQIVRLFSTDADKILDNAFRKQEGSRMGFTWPSLLEYLGLGDLFSRLPSFSEKNPLFIATVSALCEVENQEDLFYVYDSIFTEMLKQVKSLPEADAAFLLEKIKEKKEKLSFFEMEEVLSPAIAAKELALRETASQAMHDLVLYLAWDRMCVAMARLFDYQSADPKFLRNLKGLKWCLAESYLHISGQGRIKPSFFRLVEAFFYYQMREEHLQLHTESDWELLSQSFAALKKPDELVDVFYIDQELALESQRGLKAGCHLTADSPEIVHCRLALAHYTISHLKKEVPQWNYALFSSHIIHLPV